jgi:hypothetical protein
LASSSRMMKNTFHWEFGLISNRHVLVCVPPDTPSFHPETALLGWSPKILQVPCLAETYTSGIYLESGRIQDNTILSLLPPTLKILQYDSVICTPGCVTHRGGLLSEVGKCHLSVFWQPYLPASAVTGHSVSSLPWRDLLS